MHTSMSLKYEPASEPLHKQDASIMEDTERLEFGGDSPLSREGSFEREAPSREGSFEREDSAASGQAKSETERQDSSASLQATLNPAP